MRARTLVELALATPVCVWAAWPSYARAVQSVKNRSLSPAPSLRGHHDRGQLVFPLEAAPRAIAITIRGLDEPGVRILSSP